MNTVLRAIGSALAISVIMLGSHAVATAAVGKALTDNFRQSFTNRNSLLTSIQILESRPLSSKNPGTHVYLVRAIRPDNKFDGKFEEEQFGVFLVADKSKVVRVLDMFSTPRWNDYKIKIERASPSKVVISGRGASYGDEPITKTYDIGKQ